MSCDDWRTIWGPSPFGQYIRIPERLEARSDLLLRLLVVPELVIVRISLGDR